VDLDAPRSRGARPVADAPADALAARADGLAKGWLIALLERRALDAAEDLPVAALARGGPALCAAAARALGSDDALRELTGRAAAFLELAGGGGAAAAIEAAEALRAALWAAIVEALPEPRPGQLADLADRLAHVTTSLVMAALTASEAASTRTRTALDEGARAPRAAGQGKGAPPSPALADLASTAESAAPPLRPAPDPSARSGDRPVQAPDPSARSGDRPVQAPDPSARSRGGLWREALEGRLEEGSRVGERTALLLVEVDGLERLRAAGDTEEALARAAAAVRAEVRHGDLIAHEADGRAWVLAPGAGHAWAEALARRIADGVAAVPAPRGAPLTVSVGLAVHPDDGHDAGSLSAFAEEAMLAARAAGVALVR
jgi:GGDEF domain-containing protein